MVGSVADVEAVLVVANHGARHRDCRTEHGGPNQAEEHRFLRVQAEALLRTEEDTEEQEEDDERRTGHRLDAGLAHHAHGDGAEHEGGRDEHRGEQGRSHHREATEGEDGDHREEGHDHEDGNVLERPLVPALAFDVLGAAVTAEGGADVAEDGQEGLVHLRKAKQTTTDDAADGNGADGLGEGDHLQGRSAASGEVVQRDVRLCLGVVDGHVEDDRERHEDEPSDEGTHVHQQRHAELHEPANGEHGGREGQSDVGVGEGVPGALGPLRDALGHAVVGARGLVQLAVAVDAGQSEVPDAQGLGDPVQQRQLAVVDPNERVLDEEEADHRHTGPDPDGLQRITGVLDRTGVDVRSDVQHLEGGFESGQGQRIFDQPHTPEDDEVHHAEETGEHRRHDADEGQAQGLAFTQRDQRSRGQFVLGL